jgi:O-antigen/teichoic acid export membrane protein
MSRSQLAGRLSGFALNVGVTSAVGLVSIPLIIRGAGATPWAAVAVGQVVGGVAAMLVSLGWGVAGPARAAVMSAADRSRYYGASLGARGAVLAVALPVSLVVGYTAVPDHRWTTGLVAAASATYGLSAAWYFTAIGSPTALFRCETLPRALSSLAGAIGVLLGGSLLLIPASLLLGTLLATTSAWRAVSTSGPVLIPPLRSSIVGIRDALPALSVTTAVTVYSSLPVLFVAALAPAGLAPYALLDRFKTFALTALGPVVQVAQGGVVSPERAETRRRTDRACVAALGIGCLVGALFPVLAHLGARLLSDGAIEPSITLSLLIGLVVGIGVVSSVLGLACLPALGDLRAVSLSSAVGAVLFLVLAVPLATWQHATGVALSAVLAEICVLVLLTWFYLRDRTR